MKTLYNLKTSLIVLCLLMIILLSSKLYVPMLTARILYQKATDPVELSAHDVISETLATTPTISTLSSTVEYSVKELHNQDVSPRKLLNELLQLEIATKQNSLQYILPDKVNLDLYDENISALPPFIPVSLPSKELVVYTTHLYRLENGSSYVIYLIGAGPSVYRSRRVIGCGVNNQHGISFKVRYIYEDMRLHRWQKKTGKNMHPYQQLVVECYGLEVTNGDKAFLVYHNATSNETVKIYSHIPVVIPAPRKAPKQGNVSSVVCTKVLSKNVPWLREFLRYQKTFGVDHVHVSVLDTFIKDRGYRDILENDVFFVEAVRSNYVTVEVWKEWYDPQKREYFYYGNMLMYLDCIYRYRGSYDFVSLLDTDDFFTIRVPGLSYKEFLMKYCLHKGIGSCSFEWSFYYPGVCGLRREVGEDGNVTASLVPHSPRNEQPPNYKSTHLSLAVVDSSFHDASCTSCLLEGYKAILTPPDVAYVAHNRLNKNVSAIDVCH